MKQKHSIKAFIPTRWLLLALACLGLLATGCSPGFSDKPIGSKPVKVDPKQIDGVWITSGGPIYLMVTDADAGKIRVAYVNNENKKFELGQWEAELRQTGTETMVNVSEIGKNEWKGRILFGRVALDEKQILLWLPKYDELKKAVEDKKLTAEVTKDQVLIHSDYDKATDFFSSPGAVTVFDPLNPIVLMRMKWE